jgi:hypothetical protein
MPKGMVFRAETYRVPLRPARVTHENPQTMLTAAARAIPDGFPGSQSLRRTGRKASSDAWQNDIWDIYDVVPEFHSACTWVGNLLSKAKLTVFQNGTPSTNKTALDLLASMFGGEEGQSEMLRLLGVNFTAVGEAHIVTTPGSQGKDDEWRVIASIQVQGETVQDLKIEGAEAKPGTTATRMWRIHPARSDESDPPSRALLPVLTQLHRLTMVINAQADSRLKGNGILFIPQEIEMPSIPVTTVDPNTEEETTVQQSVSISQGVTQRLIKIAKIAIQDPDSAAAGVPLIIAAPGEYLEKVHWQEFFSGFDAEVKELRKEARERIGIGMDMPPEALEGVGDMNHWGAFTVDESSVKIHTEPLLEIITQSLTTGFLHPWLQSQGVPDWDTFTFEADTSALRGRPNRSKEALELYDRGALSLKALLIENGFNPDTDQPDEKEQIVFWLRQIAKNTSATPDQLAAVLEKLGVAGLPGEPQKEIEAKGAVPSGGTEDHPTRDAPDPEESEARGANSARSAFVVDPLLLAGEQTVFRALERAGNRLKTKMGRDSGIRARDLYLHAPRLPLAECSTLLDDAWSCLDGVGYPGVDMTAYRGALHEYTLMLLRYNRPYDRGDLQRHLLMSLAEDAA